MNTPITMLAAPKDDNKSRRCRSIDQQLAIATAAVQSAAGAGDNYFDILPDDLVCQILNRILDAKSLCQCLVLSKRFASLVPEVDSISVLATAPNLSTFYSTTTAASKKPVTKWTKNFLKKLVHNFIIKPLEFFQPISIELDKPENNNSNNKNKIGPAEITHWISNSLKNFSAIQSLRLELPAGGGVVGFPEEVPLLRWSAEFGKELETCAIIAATSFEDKKKADVEDGQGHQQQQSSPSSSLLQNSDDQHNNNKDNNNDNSEENNNDDNNHNNDRDQNQPLLSDADLKTRVVWILSCLIAAGARHGLVRQMVLDCPNLRIAEIVDSGKQGKLSMNEQQIKILRESIAHSPPASPENNNNNNNTAAADGNTTAAANPIWKRSAIPNLIMKLWYVPELELKGSGKVMKGATVVIVKPEASGGGTDKEDDDKMVSLGNGFCQDKDEGVDEAAREIMKSKWRLMYKMQMNSF